MRLQFTALPEGYKFAASSWAPQCSELGTGLTSSDLLSLVPSIKKTDQPQTHLQGNPADNQCLILGVPVTVTGEGKFSSKP